ncbi:aldo/keto reductase [Weissella sp. GP1]|uniref:aldo/keto reductase n=1 Tax=Weissella confusa TaxID=1583 RepID=UPI0032DB6C93
MSFLHETYTLNNGMLMPKIGLGTWQQTKQQAHDSVAAALAAGYLYVDTAQMYQNEDAVGAAIAESGIDRDTLTISTKIDASIKDYRHAAESIDDSLAALNMDYIDLLLIHAPRPWNQMEVPNVRPSRGNNYYDENLAVWQAMEEAVQAGKVKSIGVSNFNNEDVKNILDNGSITPAVNQIIYHIGMTQDVNQPFDEANGLLVEAYSPIGTGRLSRMPELQEIAAHYDRSVAQLAIRYALAKGTLPLPKANHPEYVAQNADVDFEISPADMQLLDAIKMPY